MSDLKKTSPNWPHLTVLALLLLGLAVRLIAFTNPPLDIHPTRQLHSAIMARGLYYQSHPTLPAWQVQMAVELGKAEAVIEPPVMEHLAAWLYGLTGGEHLWIPRLLSSLFWVLAGLAVYRLAFRAAGAAGGFSALVFYLLQSYAVSASRTFQPDPLMVALLSASWLFFIRWTERPTWQRTLIAGLFSGAALFVKNVAVFFLAVPYLALLMQRGLRPLWRSARTWVLAGITLLPFAAYTVYGTYMAGFLQQQFSFRFFPGLWVEPANYSRWLAQIQDTAGLPALVFALIGLLIQKHGPTRRLLFGLWAGYLLYGFTFAYHIGTHDYYQLPLLPILALSLAPLGQLVYEHLQDQHLLAGRQLGEAAAVGLLVMGLLVWQDRLVLTRTDYRSEPAFWRQLGDRLRQESVVGLTQDYGFRMSYFGWKPIVNWPGSGDFAVRELAGMETEQLQDSIQEYMTGRTYFLVTWFEDYDRQKGLKAFLEANYPVEAGDGYLLFDLSHPLLPTGGG